MNSRSNTTRRTLSAPAGGLVAALVLAACGGAPSQATSDEPQPGAEIVIGGSFPLTGPLASYGGLAKGMNAYLEQVNAAGGVKGRKVRMETMDDAYDPSRAAGNVRTLIGKKKASFVVTFGGAPLVVRDYLEQVKVPQFAFGGLSALSEVDKYHYTRGWWPDLELEGQVVGQFMHQKLGITKVATLSINNDAGEDYVRGLAKQANKSSYQVVQNQTYEPTDTQVSTQIDTVRSSGSKGLATLVVGAAEIAMLKYNSQVNLSDPTFLYSGSSSIAAFLKPAGKTADGVYAPLWLKDPADPKWSNDESLAQYRQTVAKYGAGADANDIIVANGYGLAEALVTALQATHTISPDEILNAWDHLAPTQLDVLLPGIQLEGYPKTGRPIQSYQVSRFDGSGWKSQGDVIKRTDIGK